MTQRNSRPTQSYRYNPLISLRIWYRLLFYRRDHALYQMVTPNPITPRRFIVWYAIFLPLGLIPYGGYLFLAAALMLVPLYYLTGLSFAIKLHSLTELRRIYAIPLVQTTTPGQIGAAYAVVAGFLQRPSVFFPFNLNQLIALNWYAIILIVPRILITWGANFEPDSALTTAASIMALIIALCVVVFFELRQNVVLGILSAVITSKPVMSGTFRLSTSLILVITHMINWLLALAATGLTMIITQSPIISVGTGLLVLYGSRELIIWLMHRRLVA